MEHFFMILEQKTHQYSGEYDENALPLCRQ